MSNYLGLRRQRARRFASSGGGVVSKTSEENMSDGGFLGLGFGSRFCGWLDREEISVVSAGDCAEAWRVVDVCE